MRIGINALAVVPGRSGGDGRYVRELVRELVRLEHANRYFLFVAPWNEEWFSFEAPNMRRVMCYAPQAFSARAVWEQAVLPILCAQLRLDLFHAPINVAPLAVTCPIVLTLHEAEPYMFPRDIPLPILAYWLVLRRASAYRARQVITVSESSKRDLIRYMGLAADKITVTLLGVAAARFATRGPDEAALPSGVRRPYLLWIGRTYPRKNVVRVVEAFRLLKEKGLAHQLVLVGVSGWGNPALRRALDALGALRAEVTLIGFLNDDGLAPLYRQADAFVFPSLHETFGLPVLEAMAAGTPVVTSATTATAEVAGEAAILVDPTSSVAIARGIEQALREERPDGPLVSAGRHRAGSFSWARTAEMTLEVYRQWGGKK